MKDTIFPIHEFSLFFLQMSKTGLICHGTMHLNKEVNISNIMK